MSRASRRTRSRSAPTPPPSDARHAALGPGAIALLLAGAHLAVVLVLLVPSPFEGGDNAAYLALARSLLEDGSYRNLWEPGAPAHTQYPPGWPLVIAAALAAGVKPWAGLKILAALFSAAGVALAYLWARRVSTPRIALGAGVLLALGPGVLDLGRVDLSDAPFWAFCMLALWGFAAWEARAGEERRALAPGLGGPLAAALGGVLLAYLTRSAALPLLAAAAGWLAWRRRWSVLGLGAAVVAPFALAWGIRGWRLGGGYGEYLWYVDPYRPGLGTVGPAELARRVWSNIADYTQDHLPFLLMGQRTGWVALTAGVLLLALAAAGWAGRVRGGRAGVAEWWLPLYLGLVLVWPAEWSGERFLLPVYPLLLVFAGEALAELAGRARSPAAARAAFAAAVGIPLLAFALPGISREGARTTACRAASGPLEPFACMRPPAADFMTLARSIRGELPPGSVVIARKPTLWWAESGYPSVVFPYSDRPEALLEAAREVGARYVVVDAFDNVASIHLVPAIVQRPQAFCVMRSLGSDRATLLAIRAGADTMPNLRDRPEGGVSEVGFAWCPEEFWAAGARR